MPHELSVTRFIAAPPAKVWHCMTERITEWWCPKPWRTEIETLEWRSGGLWKGMMRGPNEGEVSPMDGVFLEVTHGVRYVFTDAFQGGWFPHDPFMVGVFEIVPEADGTRYTASARHWSEEAAKNHETMGFIDGWGKVADQLKALCEAG